jgi:arylsulfatase A-like enzyme
MVRNSVVLVTDDTPAHIKPAMPWLYDLDADPFEQTNLAGSMPVN